MSDSTRIKLFLAKKRLKEDSNFSATYVRIYNQSLRDNYNMWLTIERRINTLIEAIWPKNSSMNKGTAFVAFIGRCGICGVLKVKSYIQRLYQVCLKQLIKD